MKNKSVKIDPERIERNDEQTKLFIVKPPEKKIQRIPSKKGKNNGKD